VLTNSNERGGVPSAKMRFPVPNRTGKTTSRTSSARPCSSSGDVSVELPERITSGPSCALIRRMPSTMSGPSLSAGPYARPSGRWVTTYFVAALRRSAIGLLGAFGQMPDHIS
jgi:hypothetical protein